MKKIYCLIILFILGFKISFSQSSSNFRLPTNNGNWAIKTSEGNTKGSRYLHNDWIRGVIIFNDSLISQKLPLLFDLTNNTLLSTNGKLDKNKGIELPKTKIDGFILSVNDTEYNFVKINPDEFEIPKNRLNFYQKITPSANVIKDIKKVMYDYGKSNGFTKAGKVYKTKETIFIKNKKDKYVNIKSLSKSNIIRVFGNKKDIKKYISKNNINLKNMNHLDKLINYCKKM